MKKEVATTKNEVVVNVALEGKTYKDADALNAINNKQLAQKIRNFANCESRIAGDQWKAVGYMAEMAKVDMIKRDFGSDASFAEFMGMSRTAVNKMKRLDTISEQCKDNGLTVSKGYELLPLIGLEGVNVATFIADNGIDGETTQAELRELVKAFKQSIEDKSKEADSDADAEADSNADGDTPALENDSEYEWDKDTEKTSYTLPYISENGDTLEGEFELTDKQIDELAKAVNSILKLK